MSVVTPTILSAGSKIDPTYELVSIDITREVNRIPYARLVLLDGSAAQQKFVISDSDTFAPGQEIEISFRYEGDPASAKTVFKGVVVSHAAAHIIEGNLHRSLLTIELKDKAVKLTFNRKSVVHEQMTDDAIMSKIISDAGLTPGTITATQPTHPELVQYYCTDWDFLLSRADVYGHLVAVNDGEISVSKVDFSATAVATFDYGISEIYRVEVEADAGQQFPEVQSVAWDLKNQSLTQAAKATDAPLAQGNLKGKDVATALGAAPNVLSDPVSLDPKELQAWSDGTMVRSRLALIQGRISVPGRSDIALLDMVEIAGIGKRFNGNALVTGIRQRLDSEGWQTDLQFGLRAERFAERQGITDAPAAGLLPAVYGLQIGIVDAFQADPDKEFRVRVILPGIDVKNGSVWARLASPDAGKDRGYFFRPEKGDEVVVGFLNGDPRQAVILGAMFSSKNSPHQNVSPLTQDNAQKGIITKAGAIFLFDDKKETIQITDKHGNSITMDKDGIVIKSAKDLTIDAAGKIEVKGQGDIAVNASGNVEIKGSKVDIK